jgi:hypothetical protein
MQGLGAHALLYPGAPRTTPRRLDIASPATHPRACAFAASHVSPSRPSCPPQARLSHPPPPNPPSTTSLLSLPHPPGPSIPPQATLSHLLPLPPPHHPPPHFPVTGNAIIYGWTPSVRDHYRSLCCRPRAAHCTSGFPLASNSVMRCADAGTGSGSSQSISDGEIQPVYTGRGGAAGGVRSGTHGTELGGVGASGGHRAANTKPVRAEIHVTDDPL